MASPPTGFGAQPGGGAEQPPSSAFLLCSAPALAMALLKQQQVKSQGARQCCTRRFRDGSGSRRGFDCQENRFPQGSAAQRRPSPARGSSALPWPPRPCSPAAPRSLRGGGRIWGQCPGLTPHIRTAAAGTGPLLPHVQRVLQCQHSALITRTQGGETRIRAPTPPRSLP